MPYIDFCNIIINNYLNSNFVYGRNEIIHKAIIVTILESGHRQVQMQG